MSSIGNDFDSWVRLKYPAGDGYYGRERQPLIAGLYDAAGTLAALAIAASGTVGFKYVTGGTNGTDKLLALVWDATADQTKRYVWDWTLPQEYRRDGGQTGNRSAVIVRARARLLSTGTDTNTNLELNLEASWLNANFSASTGEESDGDTAINNLGTLATPVPVKGSRVVSGAVVTVMQDKAAAGSEEAFRWFYFDVSAGMTSAQLQALLAGASVTFKLGPNEAVGTALNIEVTDIEMIFTRHLIPADKHRADQAFRA